MRRLLGLIVILAVLVPALPGVAEAGVGYRDDFGDGDYQGNDGQLSFSAPWDEFGDSGGHTSGAVHVGAENCSNNRCLHIEGEGLVVQPLGISRAADLSMFETVGLSFDIQVVPLGPTTTELWVQVYTSSGWKTIKTYDLSQATSHHKTITVDSYASKDFAVRFTVPDLVAGSVVGLDVLYHGYATIDRVELFGTLRLSSTTSTSTSATSTTATSTIAASATTSTSTTAPTTTSTTRDVTMPPAPGDARESAVSSPGGGTTTTTTVADTTTTTTAGLPLASLGPPPGTGLRDAGMGLMADYKAGMMGEMAMEPIEVLGAELEADFSMAVEVIEAAKVWIGALALVIGAAIVSGMDVRRSRRDTL